MPMNTLNVMTFIQNYHQAGCKYVSEREYVEPNRIKNA